MSDSNLSIVSIDALTSTIETLRSSKTRPIIAIDGRAGAGKSSLARVLVARIAKSAHVEYDWFHFPRNQLNSARSFDHERFLADVVEPFNRGLGVLSFLRYNWGYLAGVEDGFDPEPKRIEGAEALIVEGCQTLHAELVAYFDLRVWIEADAGESAQRGMRRDIFEYGLDPENVRKQWAEWGTLERAGLEQDDRRVRANLIFDGAIDMRET